MNINMYKIHDRATIPTRATNGSAGYDLHASEDFIIRPNDWTRISTGISTQFDSSVAAQICPRSGLAFKYGLTVGGGLIDSDYTGEIAVILMNMSNEEFRGSAGDRIAQLVFVNICINALESTGSIAETERGTGGFGSTGS